MMIHLMHILLTRSRSGDGEEENERSEEEILGSFVATTIADLEIEKEYVSSC